MAFSSADLSRDLKGSFYKYPLFEVFITRIRNIELIYDIVERLSSIIAEAVVRFRATRSTLSCDLSYGRPRRSFPLSLFLSRAHHVSFCFFTDMHEDSVYIHFIERSFGNGLKEDFHFYRKLERK